MRPRTGFTLVEMLVTLSVGSTLLALSAGIVHQTLQLAAATKANCQLAQASVEIVEQFRRDVHVATRVAVVADLKLTVYAADGATIEYEAADGQLTRIERLPEGQPRYSQLALPDRSRATFEVLPDPQRVALTVLRSSLLRGANPSIDRRIEAVVGRSWLASGQMTAANLLPDEASPAGVEVLP